MSNSTYTIRITDESGAIVFKGHFKQYNEGELSNLIVKHINESEQSRVIVELTFTQKPQPPSRSPLHPKAINMDDLTPGLTIRRHNKHGNGYLSAEAIVIGEPFKRGDKYGQDDPQAYAWILPVVTTNYGNKLV